MNSTLIANPPMGIYDNPDIHIGHASYLILLDAIARFRKKFLNEEIFYPSYSFNVYGRKGDKLVNLVDQEDFMAFLEDNTKKMIMAATKRKKLNLSSDEVVSENEPEIVRGVQSDFLQLYNTNYILQVGRAYYLDCPKIIDNSPVSKILEIINCHPPRISTELERILLENTKKPIRITRQTQYTASNPIDPSAEKLAPLFLLANMWEHRYQAEYKIFAGSNNSLTRYLFLRVLSQIALHKNSGIDELIIYPKFLPEGGYDAWNIDSLKDEFEADMMRYALLSSYTEKHEKVHLQQCRLLGGRNFVYLVANIRRVFNIGGLQEEIDLRLYPKYKDDMLKLDFPVVISNLERQLNIIGAEINRTKKEGVFRKFKNRLTLQYNTLLHLAEPIVPATVNLCRSSL